MNPPPPGTLRALAHHAGLRIGCHPDFTPAAGAPVHRSAGLCADTFDTCVFNAFHWNQLQPEHPDQWNWEKTDAAVQWAESRGLRLRGHCLLWYQMIPPWLEHLSDTAAVGRHLQRHITEVVGRYRGRVHSWDVVNECLWPKDGLETGMRRDFLQRMFGDDYLDMAFHAARVADPDAELVLNEALLSHRDQQPQRDHLLGLVRRLKARRVPVDAVGIQSHLYWDDLLPMGPLDPVATAGLIRQLEAEGLTIALTELDVFDAGFPRDSGTRDQMVARAYEEYLLPLLAEPAVRTVVFWGMGDASSWYNTYVRRVLPDRLPGPDWSSRPLLFDADYQPKPAYFAVVRALQRATVWRHGKPEQTAAAAAA